MLEFSYLTLCVVPFLFLVLYFCWERAPFHATRTLEQSYLIFWATLLIFILVHAPDSPLHPYTLVYTESPGHWLNDVSSMICALSFVMIISIFVNHVQRQELTGAL